MKTSFPLLAIFLLSNSVYAAQENTCSVSSELEKLNHWVKNIISYETTLKIEIDDRNTSIQSKLTGIRDKRLKIELITKTDQYATIQTSVYDGKYQWIESNSPMGIQVIKLDISKLTKPERPFDTSFYLMGAGLLNGEDFPETLRVILDIYDFGDECKNNGDLQLFGSLDKNKFKSYVSKSLYVANKIKSIDRYAENFGNIQLTLSKKTHELKTYSFGMKDKPLVTYQVISNTINPSLKLTDFKYKSPPNVEIEDITEMVLLQQH